MAKKRTGLLAELLPHPGETLLELLETYGMSQLELSQRTGFTTKHINEVCKGKAPITPEMAIRLSAIFNLSSAFWNSLQANYDSEYNELKNEETVTEEELSILKRVPVNELTNYGYLENVKTSNKHSLVLKLRKFFRVSSLTFLPTLIEHNYDAYRKSEQKIDEIKLATWIAMCLNDYKPSSNYLEVDRLRKELPNLKRQIMEPDINVAINNIRRILDGCGISFDVIHNIKNVPVQGYIRNMNNRILLDVTIRRKYSDIFWFTFFHEIGHILANKDKKTLNMVDYINVQDFADEIKANEFASDILISKEAYNVFKNGLINEKTIIDLAKKEGVSPSIVVGRLGHEDPKYFSKYEYLREKYEWIA